MRKRKGDVSDSDARIADKACDLVLSIDDKLKALAHSREPPAEADVVDALQAAEIAPSKGDCVISREDRDPSAPRTRPTRRPGIPGLRSLLHKS